jgi:hypothetical protein
MSQRIYISPARRGWVTLTKGSTTVTGTNTAFLSSYVGKTIRFRIDQYNVDLMGGSASFDEIDLVHVITSVTDSYTITIDSAAEVSTTGPCFYYMDYEELDTSDDSNVVLTFAVADIRDPDKRNTPWSKTVTLPGTKNNNILLSHIFEIDIEGTFNPNIKSLALIEANGLQQLKGMMQLLRVNRTGDDITYEVAFTGALKNIFTNLSDFNLTDLDFSEYDHQFDITNIANSWDGNLIKNGVSYSASPGEGYVYPVIDNGTITDFSNVLAEHLAPAIYLKTYIDKMFAFAGFTYQSNFFNSGFFYSLVVANSVCDTPLDDDVIASREFKAFLTTNTSFAMALSKNQTFSWMPFDNDSTNGATDPGNVYDASTNTFTPAFGGNYNFNINLELQLVFNSNSNFSLPNLTCSFQLRILEYSGTTLTGMVYSNNLDNIDIGATSLTAGVDMSTAVKNMSINADVRTVQGRKYVLQLFLLNDLLISGWSGSIHLVVNQGSSWGVQVSLPDIQYNDTMTLNSVVPQNLKMSDMLKSVINAFNLYVDADSYDDSKLIIEPRDDFYAAGKTIDWTSKLDISQPLVIEPMSELQYKKYLYTYKADTDQKNTEYSFRYYNIDHDEVYGEYMKVITNDFLDSSQTNKIELIFSPAVMTKPSGCDRLLPSVRFLDTNGLPAVKTTNPRLLYYAGYKDCSDWQLTHAGEIGVYSRYPFFGHVDDADNPTLDLNFGYTQFLYWRPAKYTDNNLYNKYHKKYLEEITDHDSKLITAYFYLTPQDILNLDFRNQYYINGYYLRLNKVIDYNLSDDSALTQVELLKMKYVQPFVSTSKTVTGGKNNTVNNARLPVGSNYVPRVNNNAVPAGSVHHVLGQNNITYGPNPSISILGDSNSVHPGTDHISIVNGDGNTVVAGSTNVTLINTSNVQVEQSNVTYIDGQVYVDADTAIDNRSGSVTLVSGVASVSNPSLTSTSKIMITPTGSGVLNGTLKVSGKAGGSFTITSTNNQDTAVVDYYIAHF